LLLHHEINNTLYKILFIVPLNYLQSRMKYIQQGLQFHWFLKRATTSGKISSGIKLRLRSNSANIMSLSDLRLIYVVSLNNVKH
jgi:hypothetical protein